jgi:hypothetical protein
MYLLQLGDVMIPIKTISTLKKKKKKKKKKKTTPCNLFYNALIR